MVLTTASKANLATRKLIDARVFLFYARLFKVKSNLDDIVHINFALVI